MHYVIQKTVSFFEKIAGIIEENSHDALLKSVVEQIAILFSNRNDAYWAYDFRKGELCAIHEIFKIDYFSPEFSRRLSRVIEIFDARIISAKVNVTKEKGAPIVTVDCVAMHEGKRVVLQPISFNL